MAFKIDVDVTNARIHKKGHAIFDVVVTTNELLPGQLRPTKVVWAVEHRFREFEGLLVAIKKQYGHQADVLKLPPKPLFGTTDPDFIVQRQRALHALLVSILRVVPDCTAFTQHHMGSTALRQFLAWDQRIQLSNLPEAVKNGSSNGTVEAASGSSAPVPAVGPSRPSAAQLRMQGRAAAANPTGRTAIPGPPSSTSASSAGSGPPYAAVVMPALLAPQVRIGGSGQGTIAPAVSGPTALKATATPRPAVQPAATAAPRPSAPSTTPAAAAAPPVRPAAPGPPAAAGPPRPACGPGLPGAGGGPPRPQGAPAPPRPPAPPSGVPPAAAGADPGRSSLLASIRGGASLKKAVTVGTSGPRL